MDAALREDFGFKHILWVYSGRRGAHAWVCDKRARDLPDDRRKAIAGYLEVVRGGAQSGKRVALKRPLHPHVSRSLEILKPYFASTILEDQDVFMSAESDSQSERLLTLLPDKQLVAALRKKWSSSPDRPSTSKWADIDSLARTSGIRNLDTKALRDAKQDVVLEYTYPRLDAEVSKKRIHLLKSPFVVHPATGKVCVPIDVSKVDEFEPASVPTVNRLLSEINEWDVMYRTGDSKGADSEERAPSAVQDYEKTSLKPYVEYFKQFVVALNRDERGGKRERSDDVKDEDSEGAMEF
jgi:DNA primase small subunit